MKAMSIHCARTAARGLTLLVLLVTAVACSNAEAERQRYFESGNKFFANKQYAEAIVEYRNALASDEKFAPARAKLAEAYAAAGDAQNAYRQYIRAADQLPEDNDLQLKAAAMLSMAGQLEDAKTRVQRVLARDRNNAQAHVILGSVLAGLKDLDGAVSQIEEAIQVDPSRGAPYTQLGVLKLAQGERDAARAAFDTAIKVEPQSIDARLALAVFQLQTGDGKGAEETLNGALAIDAKHAMVNRTMAALYIASNRAAEAERFVKAFVDATPSAQAKFALADYYVAMRREADAKIVLSPMTSDESTSADAHSRLAALEYASDRAAAHARIDGVITRSPQHLQALLTKSRWMLTEGRPVDALKHAQTAVAAAPKNPTAHYVTGLAQAQLADVQAATTSFNEVLRLNPRVAAAQLQLARLRLAEGAAGEAVQLAQAALKNAPDSGEARATLAGGLIAQRELTRAEPAVAALLKDFPQSPSVHAIDGMLQMAKKNNVGARAAYERALRLDPKNSSATAGLTAIDLMEKKPDAALARINQRLDESPNDVPLLILASRVFLASNNPQRAEASLRKVIELAPSNSTAFSMLGQLYIVQQRLPEARKEFDTLAARDPKDVSARTMAAMLSHATQDIADAEKRYREILTIEPGAAVAANNLAWIMAEGNGDLDEALRLAQRALAQAPDRHEIHDTVGWIYIRKELPTLAIAPFEQSVARAPGNANYHYHLALAHARSGNLDEAKKALAAALKLNPTHADAIALQKTL